MEKVPGVDVLVGNGGDVVVTRDEQSVLDGMPSISAARFPRVTPFERGMPGQHRQMSDGSWVLDELLPDERFVSINVAGKGQVVFTACSHAGLINVLSAARERFPGCTALRRLRWIPPLRTDRSDHSGDGRCPRPVQSEAHRRRALHRLARPQCPGDRLWRRAGAIGGR